MNHPSRFFWLVAAACLGLAACRHPPAQPDAEASRTPSKVLESSGEPEATSPPAEAVQVEAEPEPTPVEPEAVPVEPELETEVPAEPEPHAVPELTLDDVTGPRLEKMARPVPERKRGCVEHDVARRFNEEQAAYHRYLADVVAAERGWRRARDVMQLETDWDGAVVAAPFEIAETRADRVIDRDGHHWLGMNDWSCGRPPANFYIDEALKVFSVIPEPKCRTKKVPGCGTFPTYGCGREPPTRQRYYVRVPSGASRGPDRGVEVHAGVCFTIAPRGGYGPPPP